MRRDPKWSLGVIAFALLFPTVITWIYFVALRSAPPQLQQGAYTVGKLIQFIFPVLWVWTTRRSDLKWTGIKTTGAFWGVAFGVLIVIAMGLLYQFGLKPMGVFTLAEDKVREKVAGMGLDTLPKYAALGLFYALFHSLLEEYYWRWFVFREVRLQSSLATALLVSSVGFMAHHILVLATFFGWSSPATWLLSLCVAIGGAVWGWIYERSQSLTGPWLSHCLVDAGIFLIGYDLIRDGLR